MSTDFFKDDGVFLPMLNDVARNEFYGAALKIAAPGQVVCDIGAGTGFLTVLAIQAGAQHVIAVEKNPERFQYLKHNLESTGYADRVTMICADFLDCDIRSDVYVSETINTQIFGEDMVKLSNHARRHGGTFIPGNIKIWVEVYENHPVFVLDLTNPEAVEFEPGVCIDPAFVQSINTDVAAQYSLQDTVFTANNLNRLFTMLDRFSDLKLTKLYHGDAVNFNLNQHIDENNIVITVPTQFKQNNHALLVLKWQMSYQNSMLDSNKCWFGNVAKPIRQEYATLDQIKICYNPAIKNWRLQY